MVKLFAYNSAELNVQLPPVMHSDYERLSKFGRNHEEQSL